jgi:glycosyltransferase involved in cell wall biosynthesis
VRIVATQETDWVERNPIIHHRLLEWLSTHGSDVLVIDYDIDWRKRDGGRLVEGRREIRDAHKYFADSRVVVIRPAMLRSATIARLSWLVSNWRELRRAFRERTPDVVVGYGISNALLALVMAHAARRPFVYHVMDALHTHAEARLVRLVARTIERRTMRTADRVVVVSQGLGKYAVDMGARAERVTVIPIGVNRVAVDTALAARCRERLGLSDRDVALIFVGWQYEFSGLRELLADFARRGSLVPWLRLVIVGTGELYDELSQTRVRFGLERQVIMTGQIAVHDVGGLIEAADAGLLPARRNATMEHLVPTKVVEYMERGKAVVATRLPGLEAEFADLPGIVYIERPEDVIDRMRALERSGDPVALRARLRALGETCRTAIGARPDWERVQSEFAALLRSEADRPRV